MYKDTKKLLSLKLQFASNISLTFLLIIKLISELLNIVFLSEHFYYFFFKLRDFVLICLEFDLLYIVQNKKKKKKELI